jgi:hypothetical protein
MTHYPAGPAQNEVAPSHVESVAETPCLTERELRRLSRWMLGNHAIKAAAEALRDRDYERLSTPERYLSVLDQPFQQWLNARIIAAEALRFATLDEAQRPRAEFVLRAIVAKRQVAPMARVASGCLNLAARFCGLGFLSVAIGILSTLVFGPGARFVGDSLAMGIVSISVGLLGICMISSPLWSFSIDAKRETKLRTVCAAALGRFGGPESVQVLVSPKVDPHLAETSQIALKRVLGRLGSEDYGRVSNDALGRLTNLFRARFSTGELDVWVPLLLDSLEKVGTGACVEAVENVVKNGRKPEWKEHAARILPVLLERQRLERDSSRLLRATEGNAPVDSLLRPVVASADSSDTALLRAVEDSGDG